MDLSDKNKQKRLAYLALVIVILLWGISPLITLKFYQYFSPTIRIAFGCTISVLALLLICRKKLHLLDKSYLRVAIPTGFFMALANILQKIGLQYTTPSHYSFLENLSCLAVPVLLFFFVKKKPGVLTVTAALLCLVSSFILSSNSSNNGDASMVGDLLCALAGILYGVNIAGTGAFAKKLYAPLYLLVQMATELVVSLVGAWRLHGAQIEPVQFTFDWRILLANAVFVLITSTLCWVIRTNAMKHVDATVVAVMMPFSSVVTTVASVLLGSDTLSWSLVAGALLGLVAVILSGFGDRKKEKTTMQQPLEESC